LFACSWSAVRVWILKTPPDGLRSISRSAFHLQLRPQLQPQRHPVGAALAEVRLQQLPRSSWMLQPLHTFGAWPRRSHKFRKSRRRP
jgi:hypothetical protein